MIQQIKQVKIQGEQFMQMSSQVRMLDSYLERFGDPRNIRLQELEDLHDLVTQLPVTKSTKELERTLSEDLLFVRQDVYGEVSRDIVVDGVVVGKRDAAAYKPRLAARQSFADYHALEADALEKRQNIDRELQAAHRRLDSATTAIEISKVQALITSLNAQRSEVSKEIELAATAAIARHHQNASEEAIAREARDEEQSATQRVGIRKRSTTYRFPTDPTLFNP
ncbi:MAG: hypothetical protein ACPGN3_15950 [Opitutales bacterium]